MAEVRGYSYGTIARIWRVSGLKPNRIPAPRADGPTFWLVDIGTILYMESGSSGVRSVHQLQLFVERRAGNAESLGGFRLIAGGCIQRSANSAPLGGGEGKIVHRIGADGGSEAEMEG